MSDINAQAATLYEGIQTLLGLSTTIAELRGEVALLRREVADLRRSTAPVLISVTDAARRLGLAKKTVRRHIEKGWLRSVRVGQSVRVDLSSLPEALES